MEHRSAQSRISPDPEIIMKTDDDSVLRAELAAYVAKESQWNGERMRLKAELNHFASELLIMTRASSEKYQ